MSSKTAGMEAFFTSSNELMLNRLTEKMKSTLVPLLSSTLDSGIDEGVLSIENTDFYANYIIHGALGALNYGSDSPNENISKNIAYLPQVIANTLKIDIDILTIGNFEKGGETE